MVNTGYALNRRILVILFLAIRLSHANQLYEFGVASGDSTIAPSDDGASEEVVLSTPFVFFGTPHTSLYVSCSAVHES